MLVIFAAALLLCRETAGREAQYKVTASNDVMVTMRDGVRLATDIYLPAQNGSRPSERFPIILTRTPYDKSGSKNSGQYFASRGYVFVAQDTRGRYRSEGVWHFLTDDGSDGSDTAKWIEAQPWSNGKIGSMGTSYGGATQHALALANAPNLTAMVPVDAMSDYGRYGIRHNGAFELRWFNWVFTLGNATGTRANAAGLSRSPAGTRHRRSAVECRPRVRR